MPCPPGTRHRHSSHLLTWAGVPMVHSAKLQAGGFGINLEPFASSAHSSLHTFPQAAFAWNRFPKRNMKTSLFLLKKKNRKKTPSSPSALENHPDSMVALPQGQCHRSPDVTPILQKSLLSCLSGSTKGIRPGRLL